VAAGHDAPEVDHELRGGVNDVREVHVLALSDCVVERDVNRRLLRLLLVHCATSRQPPPARYSRTRIMYRPLRRMTATVILSRFQDTDPSASARLRMTSAMSS